VLALSRQLEEQLHYDIVCAVNHLSFRGPDRQAARANQRRRIMRRADDYLRANMDGHFSLRELAQASGTSHRMLQHFFARSTA
jgi:AraC-like DNA-binding protein